MNMNKAFIIVLMLAILNISPVFALKVESDRIESHYCIGGNSLEDSFEDDASVNILDTLVCSAEVEGGFFVGSQFPLLFELTYPSLLYQNCEFDTFVRSKGRSDARIGIEVYADIKATITLQVPLTGIEIFSWDLIDWAESLDLLAEFDKTPIGEVDTATLENKIKVVNIPLYFEAFGITLIDTEITAYLGATADVKVGCETSARLRINSNSLVDSLDGKVVWDEDDVTYYSTRATLPSAQESVSISLSDLQLELTTYVIEITSFFLELELKNLPPVRLSIPMPDDLLSVAASGLTMNLEAMNSVVVPMNVPENSMSIGTTYLLLFGGLAVVVVMIVIGKRR